MDGIAVFDSQRVIQGFLGNVALLEQGWPMFRRHARLPVAPVLSIDPEPTLVDIQAVTFTWDSMSSTRPADQTARPRWAARILVCDRPDLLALVKGFRYFTEIYGEPV